MDKKKVMVVDDEQDFLRIVKLNLESAGEYEVLTLSNTKNIVAEVNRFKPDVLLLDLLMPSVGGMEVCEMLNADPVGKRTSIIIVSALEKDKDKLNAYKLGVVDYMVKPVDRKELINKIEMAVRFK